MMVSGKILLAVDDETFGQAMVDFLVKHRWPGQTEFTVMNAIDPADAVAKWPSDQIETDAKRLVRETADKIRHALPDVVVDEVIEFARPKDAILDLADKARSNLIVMGSHGRRGVSRFLLGSVSQAVASHAPCSVAIIRFEPAETSSTDHKIDWRGTELTNQTLRRRSLAPMKVLLTVEDDRFGQLVVDFVRGHGFPDGTTFRVLHVHPWMPSERELVASPSLMEYVEQQYECARDLVAGTATKIRQALPRTSVEEEITEGQPASRILATATAWGADAIIMGSHGKTDLQQFFLGSVSAAVLSHSHCTVIILRPAQDELDLQHDQSAGKDVATTLPSLGT